MIITQKHILFLPVRLGNLRKTSKDGLAGHHGVTEDHEETTNNTKVAEEEVKVEDETVAEALNDNNAEETAYCVFCVSFGDDSRGCDEHGLGDTGQKRA